MTELTDKLLYERRLAHNGYTAIAGMDEVGRGPLAGPVVAACVILPLDRYIEGIDDSKKLSKKRREALAPMILQNAIAYGIGVVDNHTIDEINILCATKLAMKRAVEAMSIQPDYLLVDAISALDIDIPIEGIIKGDEKSYLIGAASIIAKTYRDAYMEGMNDTYPGYDFEHNMGYGTKIHREALREKGPTSIHRVSFLRKILYE